MEAATDTSLTRLVRSGNERLRAKDENPNDLQVRVVKALLQVTFKKKKKKTHGLSLKTAQGLISFASEF